MDFTPPSDIFLGPIRIHLYGLMLALAVLVSWYVASKVAPRLNLSRKLVDGALLWVVVGGFLGARLYFVASELNFFLERPELILALSTGGLSIYGGMIGGAVGLWLFCRVKRLSFLRVSDLAFLVLPLGQAIGRWGNYFNQEAFGRPTELPWGIYIEPAMRPAAYLNARFFHPTFLYEAIWNILVFLVLLSLAKKQPQPGRLAVGYLILYPVGRFFIESLRTDSVFIAGVRLEQVVSLLAVLVGALLLWRINKWQLA